MARTNTSTGGGGGGVESLNGLTGAVTLSAGNNVTLNESGNDIEITANFTQEGKYMISGGITWSGTGLTYDVSFLNYFFNGNKTANPTQVTLAASDPTNNRFDAIVVDEAGTVTTITGTPSANPEVPAIPEDQLQVTIILVAAGSTTPTIASEEIYMDDPTTNWTFSTYQTATPTGSINFAGTSSPKQGTECIEASTDARLGARFVRGTSFDAFQYTMLQVWVRFTGTAVASNKSLNVRFENSAGTLVANTVNLFNYGLQRGVLNTWQLVVVPITAFGALPATVKGLKMIMAGGTVGVVRQWDIDFMILTNGSVPFANVPTIAFYKDDVGIASQSGINLIEGTGVTIDAVNNPLYNRVDYTINAGASSITEGAPTQADRASVDIQVLDTDYESIIGLQLTFGTSQQQVLEFYDSDSDPVPTAPIIGVNMGGGIYRAASDILVGPGSVPATLIDYSSLVGTFSEGEQVAEVFAYADYFGYDPNGDSVYYVYNSTANFQAGIVQNIDAAESSSTGAFTQTVTLATIDYGTLTDTFVQYEGVDNGLGDTGKIFFDNGSNQMSILVGTGTFTVGQTLTGDESGATCIITAISSFTGDEVSGSVLGTIGDSLYNYNSTLKEIIIDNGTDEMYTTDNGTYTSGNTLLGLTSNATADIDSASNVNINYINDGDTVTIGGKTYTWQTTLTDVDGNVQLGVDDGDSLNNLSLALQLDGTPGSTYAASMTANTLVRSGGSSSTSLDVIALIPGTAGNLIAVSQSIASGEYDWATPTLDTGSDPTTNTIALIIRSAINSHVGITGIASQNILADNKVLGRPIVITDDDTVTIYSIRPGTYGNGIAVDSTDTAVINPLTSSTTGGADNGTTGAVGSLRKGIVVTGAPIPNNGSQYSDCVFQAIDNNVWIIISSATDTDGYDWYDV